MYDILYVGTDTALKFTENLVHTEFPKAEIGRDWDDVHDYRLTVELPDKMEDTYMEFVVREGLGAISFIIQMTIASHNKEKRR